MPCIHPWARGRGGCRHTTWLRARCEEFVSVGRRRVRRVRRGCFFLLLRRVARGVGGPLSQTGPMSTSDLVSWPGRAASFSSLVARAGDRAAGPHPYAGVIAAVDIRFLACLNHYIHLEVCCPRLTAAGFPKPCSPCPHQPLVCVCVCVCRPKSSWTQCPLFKALARPGCYLTHASQPSRSWSGRCCFRRRPEACHISASYPSMLSLSAGEAVDIGTASLVSLRRVG